LQQIKKKAKAEGKSCHGKTIFSLEAFQVQVYLQQNKKKAEAEADKAYMKDTPHVPLRQIDEE
jgi:hypothetical protein